ncbi:MAG: VCBS repeat-containing protein, partial [Myxococcota bacterium]
ATALEFVDRDGDGRAELLVWREGLVEVLEGGAEPSPLPAGAVSVVGDLDGDGRRDLVVAGDDVAVVLQEEDGGYAVGERITISASSQPSRAVAVVDVNRDGFLDLLTALSGEAGLLLSQGGFGGLDPVGHVLPLPSEATALDVGLLDPARNRDLVVTCPGAGEVVVWDDVASSPQTSTPAQRLLVAELVEARLVNADEDAVPELAILSGGAATAQVAILDNDGTSPFGMSLATIALPAASQPPTDLRVADLDGDGVTELLVAMRPLSLVRVLKRDTGGVWSHVDDFEQAGATLEAFALGDWNANGRRELVVALVDTMGSPTLDVWSWDGMLFSREGVSMPLLQPPDELLLDDMNIDGRLDALLLNRTSSQVALGVQTAGGLALSSWALAGGTAAATTVDWSGDGWPDLVSVGDAQTLGVQQLR